MQSEENEGLVKRNVTQTSIRSSTQAVATVAWNPSHVSTCSSAFVNKALIRRGMTTKGISSEARRDYCGFILGLSYLALASLAVVFTSSTAELKSLMFSEEYRPAGLLYWLVTTLEPKGRALLLWLEPMCFTSCQQRAEKVGLPWVLEKQKEMSTGVRNLWNAHAAWNVQNPTEQTRQNFYWL